MKRLIYNIWILSVVGLLASCTSDDTIWKEAGNGSIKLQFTDGLLLSRAADTDAERAISHLDVFIFKTDGTTPIHERINNPTVSGLNNEGIVTLNAQLKDFAGRSENIVYVVANAKDNLSSIQTLTDLQEKVQTDERIHVTATTATGAPQYFLMDGQASATSNGIPGTITISSDVNDDVTMYVTLKRAAAKVVVTLSQGDGEYKFLQDASLNYDMGYYFRNMPYKTKLLSGSPQSYPSDDYLRIPDKANDSAFEWCKNNENKVVVTAYVYSHKWINSENEVHTKGTSLVVNIPLWRDTDGDNIVDADEEVYENSYYQLPIVEANNNVWTINRNTLYTITAAINAPGAEDHKQPHIIDNLKYHTEAWKSVPVSVGAENSPKYLEVNKVLLEMHNVAIDETLEFTSSSPITVSVSDAYYYNKYGVKTNVPISGNISVPASIKALNGVITVSSKIPENLTARYFTVTVTNQDGLSENIKVIQYPVICVSNQLGWYSYRDDFNFNWESNSQSGARVSVGANNNDGEYTDNYYGTNAANNNGYKSNDRRYLNYFFNSKVIENITDENRNSAKHTSYFYNGSKGTSKCETHNMRMYQMQVMATSHEYVVGRPRITNGKTDSSVENNQLVSPAFMIASRLGAVYSGYGKTNELKNGGDGGLQYNEQNRTFSNVRLYAKQSWGSTIYEPTTDNANYNLANDELLEFYANHCENYVEVVGEGANQKVYKDWRLPTAAEIVFIINNQGESGDDADAIDYLLNGAFYYSARGPIYNPKRPNTENGKAIRCVHDLDNPNLVISKKE